MRLVVLDTNVVVSAGISPDGAPGILIDDWVLNGHLGIVTCPRILLEYRVVVWRQKFRRHRFPPEWLETMLHRSLQLPDPPAWPHPLPDPTDAPFLALAKTAGAWLITGNLKHFPHSARNGVPVLPPADYLAHLCESESNP